MFCLWRAAGHGPASHVLTLWICRLATRDDLPELQQIVVKKSDISKNEGYFETASFTFLRFFGLASIMFSTGRIGKLALA